MNDNFSILQTPVIVWKSLKNSNSENVFCVQWFWLMKAIFCYWRNVMQKTKNESTNRPTFNQLILQGHRISSLDKSRPKNPHSNLVSTVSNELSSGTFRAEKFSKDRNIDMKTMYRSNRLEV